MIQIAPTKKDTSVIDKNKCTRDDLHKDDDFDPDLETILNCIKQIMESNDLIYLEDSFIFLISYLEKNDYVFPPDFILKILSFLKEQQNSQQINNILKLVRLFTAFDSIMQQFLIDNEIFEILFNYFPNDEVIDTFSNLACASIEAKIYLLDSNIVDFIIDNINDLNYFDCLILLSRNILFNNNDDFKYDQYVPQFTHLFHILFSKLNFIDDYSAALIIDATRYYVEANDSFFHDFLTNNYFQLFAKRNINTYEFIRPLLKICNTIVEKGKNEGAQYLIDNDLLNLIPKIIFNENQEIRILCFALLYILIDYNPNITDDLIIQDYHTISVSEFNSESSFRYKASIFKFCCLLLDNASPEYIEELIKVGVVNMLIDYPSVLKYESDWIILIEGICRLEEFKNEESVQGLFLYMRKSEDFVDWIQEAGKSENSEVSGLSTYIFFELLDLGDDQDYD